MAIISGWVVHESTWVVQRVRHYVSGARDYGAVHEYEWCTSRSVARDGRTRVCSGARVVHEIMEWCTSSAQAWVVQEYGVSDARIIPCTWIARSWVCTWIARSWVCTWIARSWAVVWTLPRKSCGPLGGHEQGGTGTAAVDWVWTSRKKQLAAVLLVDMSKVMQGQQPTTGHGTSREKQLVLSKAKTRAAGGGEEKTGEEEL